jgi:Zn finger protein HypA/HybF involved in hydrogenase expression
MVAPWHLARCDNCRFEFHGGHDHHTFSEAFLCIDCISIYELVTQLEFGPTPNELVPIYRVVIKKKWLQGITQERIATGFTARAVAGEIDFEGGNIIEVVSYELLDFQCDCGSRHFMFDLSEYTSCPKCKNESLQVHSVIY